MTTEITPPVELLQRLIRFDTTNPPGNERECILYINALLHDAGIETTFLSRDPLRPNLLARLKGQGAKPPLLLYGHVDVVSTEGQRWTHPPFGAEIHNGCVWGRGALDMKGGMAMMISALLQAKQQNVPLHGDVVLAIVSDEEDRSEYGARYLVRQHAALFKDIRHAIGEFGGFSMRIEGKRFYPIMVAEKGACRVRATVRGQGGHGSIPVRDGATARLGRMLDAIDRHPLPVHLTSVARGMIERIAAEISKPRGMMLRQLLNPRLAGPMLDRFSGPLALFSPLLRNTVVPTRIATPEGAGINVIPSEITMGLDGRLLPGFSSRDLETELRKLIGPDVELELVPDVLSPDEPDMRLFDTLDGVLRRADPEAIPIPMLLPGITDARFFRQLGIQTYGFLPMKLPDELNFTSLIHAADERIPLETMNHGTKTLLEAIREIQRI